MKKITSLLAGIIFSLHLHAQKVLVTTSVENVGDGYNSVYRVMIPHAKIKDVQKEWRSFLKDNKAKVKGTKDELRGENAIIRGISSDTMQIFSRITEADSGTTLMAGFDKMGTFISPTTSVEDDAKVKQILHDMAMRLSTSAINDETKDASSRLKDQLKTERSLKKRNERLAADNERMRKQIQSQEAMIIKNEEQLLKLKTDIEEQKLHIDNIKDKTKELE